MKHQVLASQKKQNQTPYEKLKENNPDLAYKLLEYQTDNAIRFWMRTDTGKDNLQKYTQEELDNLIKHLGYEVEEVK